MQIQNDYDKYVNTGDIGMIDDGAVAVDFVARDVTFLFGDLEPPVPCTSARRAARLVIPLKISCVSK